MTREPITPEDRLNDMVEAGRTCMSWLDGLTVQQLADNRMLFHAICRLLIVMGEAASHVPSSYRARLSAIPWTKVVGLRNLIAHQYWIVELGLIFLVVRNQVPVLVNLIDAWQREAPQQ